MINEVTSVMNMLQPRDLSAVPGAEAPSMIPLIIGGVVGLVFAVIMIASIWKVFTKAGQPGWAAIVPFYNIFILHKISGKPMWALILCFIPCGPLPLVGQVVIGMGVAEKFGKSSGFGIGLGIAGFIFYPMLAFSDAQYQG